MGYSDAIEKFYESECENQAKMNRQKISLHNNLTTEQKIDVLFGVMLSGMNHVQTNDLYKKLAEQDGYNLPSVNGKAVIKR